jgi:hypothetical protein
LDTPVFLNSAKLSLSFALYLGLGVLSVERQLYWRELDLYSSGDKEEAEVDVREDREADDDEDDIELLAAGDILLYCSGVPEEGLPFVILRLTIACNMRACAFSIP